MHNPQKFLMMILLFFIAFSGMGQNADWSKFVSKDRSLSFQYPAGWKVKEEESNITITQPSTDEELQVQGLSLERGQTPEQLGKLILAAARQTYPDLNGTVRQSTRDSALFDTTYTEKNKKYSSVVVVAKLAESALWFSYAAPSSGYDRSRGEKFVQRLMTSFGKGTEAPTTLLQNSGKEPMKPATDMKGLGFIGDWSTNIGGMADMVDARTGAYRHSGTYCESFRFTPDGKGTSLIMGSNFVDHGIAVNHGIYTVRGDLLTFHRTSESYTCLTTSSRSFKDKPIDVVNVYRWWLEDSGETLVLQEILDKEGNTGPKTYLHRQKVGATKSRAP